MAKNVHLGAGTGHFTVTAFPVMISVVRRAAEINWPWVIGYAAITLAGLVAAYFLSGWLSVLAAIVVALGTLYVGYRMARTIVTIIER
jgi:hypothetical protein